MVKRINYIVMLAVLFAIVCVHSIQAIASTLPLKKGDIIRVESREGKEKLVFLGFHDERIVVKNLEDDKQNEITFADLKRLYLYKGQRTRGQGASLGFIYGMLCGMSTGVVIGLTTDGQSSGELDILKLNRFEAVGLFGIGFGVVGGIIGSAVGFIHPGEEWQKLYENDMLGFEFNDNGEMEVSVNFWF